MLYFVQLFTGWGRGRARGLGRDARALPQKGRQARPFAWEWGRFEVEAARAGGLSRNPPASRRRPRKTPPAKENAPAPRFRENAEQARKLSTEAPQTTTEYKLYVFFYKKTGRGTRKENERKKFPRFPPFPPLSLFALAATPLSSRLSLSLSLSLDQNSFSLFLSLPLSLSPSLSRIIKNTGVLF